MLPSLYTDVRSTLMVLLAFKGVSWGSAGGQHPPPGTNGIFTVHAAFASMPVCHAWHAVDIRPSPPPPRRWCTHSLQTPAHSIFFFSTPLTKGLPCLPPHPRSHPQYNATLDDMDQTHFSLWAIMSSPLILGFDLTNSSLVERVWPIVTNIEVIAVSQNWGGHPGRRAAYASTNTTYKSQHLPNYEIWAKPLPKSEWGVLLVNNMAHPQNITVLFSDVPWSGPAKLRDLHHRKDLGTTSGSYTAYNVPIFGSVFLLFSKP